MRGGGGFEAAAALVARRAQSTTLRTLFSYSFPPENKSRYAKVDAVCELIGFLFLFGCPLLMELCTRESARCFLL